MSYIQVKANALGLVPDLAALFPALNYFRAGGIMKIIDNDLYHWKCYTKLSQLALNVNQPCVPFKSFKERYNISNLFFFFGGGEVEELMTK